MNEPMNQGIQMLLERMKTNPEEFRMEEGAMYSSNRWSRLVHSAISNEVFTKEESDAVREALRVARRDIFTADVVRTLTTEVDDPIKEEWINEAIVRGSTTGRIFSAVGAGGTGNTIAYNNSGVPIK
jgi:hypothetical protein